MPITAPTSGDLAQIAQQYGLHLQPEDLESFRALASGLLASYDEVERLYEASAPGPPQLSRPRSSYGFGDFLHDVGYVLGGTDKKQANLNMRYELSPRY